MHAACARLMRCFRFAAALLAAGLAFAAPAEKTTGPSQFIPASSPHFGFEGRLDRRDPAGPVLVWQASRIKIGFEGDAIALRFSDLQGQVFFDARVDGRVTRVDLPAGTTRLRLLLSGFGPGAHQLTLFKRSEGNAGTVRFNGIEVIPGSRLCSVPPPHYGRRFLFVGDSITAGACNEDGAHDQWDDRSTHNAANSYAAMTAAAFEADHQNIAVSGMGVAEGWTIEKADETWDRLYPDPRAPRADLSTWIPDVVFVNLGENDNSFTAAQRRPFPAQFVPRYVAMVRAMRASFPTAKIVLLRGGMFGGARSEPLRLAWEKVVAELQATDPAVLSFVFEHWAQQHPRVADDRRMADELIAWLKETGV